MMRSRHPWTYIFLAALLTAGGCRSDAPIRSDRILSDGSDETAAPPPSLMKDPVVTFPNEVPIFSMAISPTGRHLALGTTKFVVLGDIHEPGSVKIFQAGTRDVLSLAFGPDGKTLAVGSYINIELLDIGTGRRLGTLPGHAEYVHALAFSPDGRLLASGSQGVETAVHVWNIGERRLLRRLAYNTGHADVIRALAFSPDGGWLASVGLDRSVLIWDVTRNYLVPHHTLFDPAATPLAVAFSPDSGLLAAGTSEGRILLYDLTDGKTAGTISGHRGEVVSVAFSPDAKTLVSIGMDETVRRWDVQTGESLTVRGLNEEIQFGEIAADGAHMAVSGPLRTEVFALHNEEEGISR